MGQLSKILSSLSYSPALVEELNKYARRLRTETRIRAAGCVISVLLLLLQGIVFAFPPEQSNTASRNDTVFGGLPSINSAQQLYAQESSAFRSQADILGITAGEIDSLQLSNDFSLGSSLYIWGRQPYIGSKQQESAYEKNGYTFFARTAISYAPILVDNRLAVFSGYAKSIGWFAILPTSGNFITQSLPDQPAPSAISRTVSSSLESTVVPDSQFTYTLTVSNSSSTTSEVLPELFLADTAEYVEIIDTGGGYLESSNDIVRWKSVTLTPEESASYTVTLRTPHSIASTPTGLSNPRSFDCEIIVASDNVVQRNVQCPIGKQISYMIETLPRTTTVILAIFLFSSSATYFFLYARSRQLASELRKIRFSLNSGDLHS